MFKIQMFNISLLAPGIVRGLAVTEAATAEQKKCKTNPIISCWVLRDAYCENEFEKQTQSFDSAQDER